MLSQLSSRFLVSTKHEPRLVKMDLFLEIKDLRFVIRSQQLIYEPLRI